MDKVIRYRNVPVDNFPYEEFPFRKDHVPKLLPKAIRFMVVIAKII